MKMVMLVKLVKRQEQRSRDFAGRHFIWCAQLVTRKHVLPGQNSEFRACEVRNVPAAHCPGSLRRQTISQVFNASSNPVESFFRFRPSFSRYTK